MFDYVSEDEFNKHQLKLASRLKNTKPVNGTRKFHSYKPLDEESVECRIFSDHKKKCNKNVNVIQIM